MLKIYTGNHKNALKDVEVTYEFPENSLSPYEQIEWFDKHLPEFKGEGEVSVKTYSPYILNYINLLLIRGDLDYSVLEAQERYWDEETDEISEWSLKVLNEGVQLIDTVSLSEPISWIYNQYNSIKEKKDGKC